MESKHNIPNNTMCDSTFDVIAFEPKEDFVKTRIANEYILVSDKDSKVIACERSYLAIKGIALLCRSSGGEVTIFKAMKG
jgi:hypothetical protein